MSASTLFAVLITISFAILFPLAAIISGWPGIIGVALPLPVAVGIWLLLRS